MSAFAGAVMGAAATSIRYTITQGTSGGTVGYLSGSLGTIDRDDWKGYAINGLYVATSFTPDRLYIEIVGASAPPQNVFYELEWVDDASSYLASAATYSATATKGTWYWDTTGLPVNDPNDQFILR